ncbi:MAG: chaperone NapD, partial [Geminicoccaceae bacterium]
AMNQAEVPIADPKGKLVVYLETATLQQVTNGIDVITTLPGVLGCTLVSHHVEDTAGLDEPLDARA